MKIQENGKGCLFIFLPKEYCNVKGWRKGDKLDKIEGFDGSLIIRKAKQ